jgi:hypothetical protein
VETALDRVPHHPTLLQRAVPVLGLPVALLLGTWIAVGRGLAGAAGELVLLYTLTLALPLTGLLAVASALLVRDARAHVPRGASLRSALTMPAAWAVLLGFGAVLPDRVDGAGASVLTRATDPVHLGLSAGFANTLGILSFVLASTTVVFAASDLRRTRRIQRGEPLSEDEILDLQGL